VDDTNIESAVVAIAAGFGPGEDELLFTDKLGITGSYDSSTGVLSLTGPASLADYETAIRSITYNNTSDDPSALTRTIDFIVNDGDANSNTAPRQIVINPINDTPTLASVEPTSLFYTENDPATPVTSTLTLSDLDDTTMQSATVSITQNFLASEDSLNFIDQPGISGNYDSGIGILTLTGPASLADFEAALRSVTYANSSENPSAANRTISFTTTDNTGSSNLVSRTVEVSPVNDPPQGTTKTSEILEDSVYTLTSADFGFSDQFDDHNFKGVIIRQLPTNGALQLSAIPVNVDDFIDIADINSGNLKFTPVPNANDIAYDRFEFSVVDDGGSALGGIDTALLNNEIIFDVINVNDPPGGEDKTVTTLEDTTYTFARDDFSFHDVYDNDQFIAVTISSLPNSGVLTNNGVPITAGTVIDIADIDNELFKYSPPPNLNGSGYNGFAFLVHDSGGNANDGIFIDTTQNYINFDVPSVNDPPLLINQGKTVDEGSANVIATDVLSATDADDTSPDELSFTINSLPLHGELQRNGVDLEIGDTFTLRAILQNEITYTHDGSETSLDSFDFNLRDGGEDGVLPIESNFAITVDEVIDPAPVIFDELLRLQFAQPFDSLQGDKLESGFSTLASVRLTENPALIVTEGTTPPAYGTVDINPDGTFTYQHNGGNVLQDRFSYIVTNEDDISSTAYVDVEIEPAIASAFDTTPPVAGSIEPEPAAETVEESNTTEEPVDKFKYEISIENDLIFPARSESGDADVVIQIRQLEQPSSQELSALYKTLEGLGVAQHNKVHGTELDHQTFELSDISESLLSVTKTNRPYEVVSNQSFLEGLEQLGRDLDDDEFRREGRIKLASDTVVGVTLSSTTGALIWLLRGGAIFTSALATTPMWSSIDPMRVAGTAKREDDTPREDNEVEQYFK